jgi:hypothetical protein
MSCFLRISEVEGIHRESFNVNIFDLPMEKKWVLGAVK